VWTLQSAFGRTGCALESFVQPLAVRPHLSPRRNVTSFDVGWTCDCVVFRPQREPKQSECHSVDFKAEREVVRARLQNRPCV